MRGASLSAAIPASTALIAWAPAVSERDRCFPDATPHADGDHGGWSYAYGRSAYGPAVPGNWLNSCSRMGSPHGSDGRYGTCTFYAFGDPAHNDAGDGSAPYGLDDYGSLPYASGSYDTANLASHWGVLLCINPPGWPTAAADEEPYQRGLAARYAGQPGIVGW